MKFSLLICGIFGALITAPVGAVIDMDEIDLPEGFSIEIYAEDVDNARQMALGEKGTLFVGSRKDHVNAVLDEDGDFRADRVMEIIDDLDIPSGLEFRGGSLYVGDANRVLRFDNIESRLDKPPAPVVVSATLPDGIHHHWKYLRFAPDGRLYLNIGAPCNICDKEGFATIRRVNVANGTHEEFARGVRNSVGLAFHPDTGELWFTDNGRDMMGDDMPSDELNHAPRAGMHFGYPYCHQGDTLDPEFGAGRDCADFTPPEVKLGPHVAPLGLAFYTGDMFPEEYRGQLFIAEHGSWNRSERIGYRIKLVRFNEAGEVEGQEVFASGWLQDGEVLGRPTDVMMLPDGSLLVSDDREDVIYRITYSAPGS